MVLFYTPIKHQKTIVFYEVLRGYRKATPGVNELIKEFQEECPDGTIQNWFVKFNKQAFFNNLWKWIK